MIAKMGRLFVFCSFVVVVLSVCCSADYTPVTNYFYDNASWSNDEYPVMKAEFVCDAGTYVFRASGGNDCLFAISTTQNAIASCTSFINWNGTVSNRDISIICNTPVGNYWYGHGADGEGFNCLYGGIVPNMYTGSVSGFEITSPDKLIADFSAFLGTIPVPTISSYNIPIGYVAVFDNTSDVSLNTYFPTKSGNLYVPEMGYWGYTAQQFGLISGNVPTSYPTSFGSSIIWSKSDPLDIWGNTYHGVSSISGSTGKLYIYNPVYRNVSRITAEYDPAGINGTITVSGTGISNFRLYPVTAGFGLHDDIIGDIDTNDYVSVEVDPDTDQPIYTDPEDNPVAEPSPGGSTSVPEEVTNQNFLEKILQVLRNLLAEIGSLFTFAYDAVSSLVSAATAFFAVIAGLFVWLPEEVVTVVISGFVLVVTIGVLKSFL